MWGQGVYAKFLYLPFNFVVNLKPLQKDSLRKTEKKGDIKSMMYGFHLSKLGREEMQIKSKVSRREEIIKMRAAINELENKKSVEKINETKS